MIKTITCPETDIQHLISALRSLDVFAKFSDHQLCKLKAKKTEASVCNFCLVRSLVFRCQSYTGRRSFKPNELLVVLKTEVLPESTTSGLLSLIQHVSSFVPNLMEYFMVKSQGHLNFKITLPQGDNDDLSTKVRNYLEKRTIESLPSVLIVESKSEFSVNIEEALQHENTIWHCKFIRTSVSTFFRTKGGFFEEGRLDVEKRKHFPDVFEAIFETTQPHQISENLRSEFIYSGMEAQNRIRDCTVARKLRKDRHHDTKDRHHDTETRRQHDNEDRHRDTKDRHHDTKDRQKHHKSTSHQNNSDMKQDTRNQLH